MGNEDNARKPEIQIVEISRVVPTIIKKFSVKPYLRNMPKPVYNVRTKPRGLDYGA